ncbi:hypothetical protein AVEN_24801-1 [Araneus ventricosus]|uniref:Uncharacterized protein n=1 Tax=Araneus ventricosus TaxID=182803 RepID=A0A4Y2BU33_ARAVE|nr:hypothetical protein AVEN_24801-1 [Araneus ventricosus]
MGPSEARERHQERQYKQEKHSHRLCSAVIEQGEPSAIGQDASRRRVAPTPSRGTAVTGREWTGSSVLTGRHWDRPWWERVGSSMARERHQVRQNKQEMHSHRFCPSVIQQGELSVIGQDASSRSAAFPPSRGRAVTGREWTGTSVLTGRDWDLLWWERVGSSVARERHHVSLNEQEKHSHRYFPIVIE